MNVVDLNADVGESYGLMHSGMDAEIIPHVTSVNIASGFHSGDPDTIKKTVELAISAGKSIGAHPSYPDLQGFGRRKIDMDFESIENLTNYQIGAMHAFAKENAYDSVAGTYFCIGNARIFIGNTCFTYIKHAVV